MAIGEIAVAIPAINSALTLFDRVSKMVKSSANIEAQEALLSLREVLLTVKEENLALKQDNLSLKEELGVLKKSTELKDELVFEDPVFYRFVEGNKQDSAYCAHCYGSNGKINRLSVVEDGLWKCSVCKETAETQVHRIKRSQPVQTRAIVSRGLNDWMR